MKDKISVLMTIYNEPVEYIKKSVNSILKQTYNRFEIIIIVDSPQNNDAINFLRELKDERIRLFINSKNEGLPKSLNIALSKASGKYIARMDADDYSLPYRFEKEITFLKNNNYDLVASNVIDVDESGIPKGTGTNYPQSNKNIKKFLKYSSCMPHPTWLGKTKIFESLRGYRNIDSCEDYDFLLRGAEAGFKYGLIKEPLLEYRINSNGITQTKESFQKLISYYLASSYKKNRIVNLKELRDYLDSNLAKEELSVIREFDKKSLGKNKNEILKLFLYSIVNKEARRVVVRKIHRKICSKR